jgi:hypothetical protein
VTPFPCYAARSVEQLPIHDDTAATSCSQDDTEYNVRILCRTIRGFGQGEAVGVIRNPNRAAQRVC